ncbi:Hypothetical protein NTJ_11964 [Nesidiocoris tenuis]|uniref:Uncharacterized protein n=1 Tax=Nesidiocoris tenuis TaxID=355587 RepID=A0ABN7B404_9HEMI|nr:Hypothetical protein NTJ_11964 [Nesidiocoris tenuis]
MWCKNEISRHNVDRRALGAQPAYEPSRRWAPPPPAPRTTPSHRRPLAPRPFAPPPPRTPPIHTATPSHPAPCTATPSHPAHSHRHPLSPRPPTPPPPAPRPLAQPGSPTGARSHRRPPSWNEVSEQQRTTDV